MKRFSLCALAAVTVIVSIPVAAVAENAEYRNIDTGDWEAGVLLGEPTGFSLKYWSTWNGGIDFGAAWSFEGEGYLHFHADYLFHNFDFFELEEGDMPVYFGVGGRMRLEDEEARVGVRFSFGVEYVFEDHPISIFVEVAPIVDFLPETEGSVNGGLGVRYIF